MPNGKWHLWIWQNKNKVDGIIGVTYSKVEEERIGKHGFCFHRPSLQITHPMCGREITGRAAGLQQENLHKRGSTNLLCFMTMSSVDSEVRKRRVGFTEYCMEHDLSCNSVEMSEKQIVSVYESYGSRKLIHNMLRAYISPSMGEHSIDGIFTSSDHLATIVQGRTRRDGKTGWKISRLSDTMVCSFKSGKPIVSSIAQPVHEIAKRGCKVPERTDREWKNRRKYKDW